MCINVVKTFIFVHYINSTGFVIWRHPRQDHWTHRSKIHQRNEWSLQQQYNIPTIPARLKGARLDKSPMRRNGNKTVTDILLLQTKHWMCHLIPLLCICCIRTYPQCRMSYSQAWRLDPHPRRKFSKPFKKWQAWNESSSANRRLKHKRTRKMTIILHCWMTLHLRMLNGVFFEEWIAPPRDASA